MRADMHMPSAQSQFGKTALFLLHDTLGKIKLYRQSMFDDYKEFAEEKW